ncbi:unnamed protein product [Sphagnum tenellum]
MAQQGSSPPPPPPRSQQQTTTALHARWGPADQQKQHVERERERGRLRNTTSVESSGVRLPSSAVVCRVRSQ